MNEPSILEVELFPPEVDSLDHPYVTQFREMLEDVAKEYHCRLLLFDIDAGTVSFSFDKRSRLSFSG